ncbi:EamA family transporter [Bosea sp. 117]|uniref:DMT family transporter n=1 Tax=Bosea sp. 117 TaxID=1125973 RepID=UPI000493EC13|nr:EamA family transporter [Bosea sp. 117]
MPLKDKLLAIAVVSAWALNMIIVKQGVAEIPPILMSALRFALVAALVVPFTRITREQLPWLLLVSLTFGLMHFGLLFIALSMSEVGTTAVLVQLGAPIATVLAAIFFRERLGLARILGLAVTLVGIGVLAAGPTLPAPMPLLLLVLSASGWAVSNLVIKSMPEIAPVTVMGWTSLIATPMLALLSFALEDGQVQALAAAGWHGWLSVVYSAVISSIIAYGVWYWLLQRHPVNSVVPYSMVQPMLTVIFGIALLGDTPAPIKLIGAAIVVAGVALVLRRPADLLPEQA